MKGMFLRWPLVQQIIHGADGTGREAMSDATKSLKPKSSGAQVTRSICPHCGVGCVGILPFHFATSGMASAAALLELRGHESRALNAVGIITALGETAIGRPLNFAKARR